MSGRNEGTALPLNPTQKENKYRSRGVLLLLIWLCTCAASGCRRDALYSHYERVGESGWEKKQEVFFSFPVSDTVRRYRVEAAVRLSGEYPYNTLPLGVVLESPYRTFRQKIVELPIPRQYPLKRGGYRLYQIDFVIEPEEKFETLGTYTYSLRSLLGDSILPGIVEVGLTLR